MKLRYAIIIGVLCYGAGWNVKQYQVWASEVCEPTMYGLTLCERIER